jgi:hypothetical protein
MLIKTSPKKQAGLYDFLNSGGSVGVQDIGVHLPNFCWITGFWVTAYTPLGSGGVATISFGTITTDIAVPVAVVNNLMVANAFGAFGAQPLQGVDLNANPLRLLNSSDVIMAIGGADLTAGKLAFIIEYSEIVPGF